MAHKTLIDGTAYEISGGKTLIDGTAYSIDKGKTLVDGTAYEVSFAKPIPVITTSSVSYSSDYVGLAYIEFVDVAGKAWKVDSQGGVLDVDASTAAGAPIWANTFEVPAGTIITCYVESKNSYYKAYVSVNGTKVVNKGDDDMTYAYTVVGNANIELYTRGTSTSNAYGYIKITEIPEGQITFTVSGERYFADEGMTWGEWVDSEYNPEHSGGANVYAVDGNMIRNIDEGLYVCSRSDYTFTSPDMPIVPNGDYYLTKD